MSFKWNFDQLAENSDCNALVSICTSYTYL